MRNGLFFCRDVLQQVAFPDFPQERQLPPGLFRCILPGSRRLRIAAEGIGPVGEGPAPFPGGDIGHVEGEPAAVHDILVPNEAGGIVLSVELHRRDINMLGSIVPGLDDEVLSVFEVDGDLVEQGASEGVLSYAGRDGVESHTVEDVPRGHRAAVLVAGESLGRGVEETLE